MTCPQLGFAVAVYTKNDSEKYMLELIEDLLSFGISTLDEKLKGILNTDLVIIASRPSMGKTSLACNLMNNVAIKQKKSAAYFCMDCSDVHLASKLSSMIQTTKLINGDLSNIERDSIAQNLQTLAKTNILIDDSPNLSLKQIIKRSKKQNKKNKIDLIIIDNLQLMNIKEMKNQYNGLCELLKKLKNFTKKYKIPVILLSQLSKQLEMRTNRRPTINDFRDSGAIGDIADKIILLYRDEIYFSNSKYKTLAEVTIAKNRDGSMCMVPLIFLRETQRFYTILNNNTTQLTIMTELTGN